MHINVCIQIAAVSIANFQNIILNLSKSDFTLYYLHFSSTVFLEALLSSPHCNVNELSHPKLIFLGLKKNP